MCYERIQSSDDSIINLGWNGNWLMNVGTDLTYPKAIYPLVYIFGISEIYNLNDVNGYPAISAVRIGEPLGTGLYVVA